MKWWPGGIFLFKISKLIGMAGDFDWKAGREILQNQLKKVMNHIAYVCGYSVVVRGTNPAVVTTSVCMLVSIAKDLPSTVIAPSVNYVCRLTY